MTESTFGFQGHEEYERFSFELDRNNVKLYYLVSDTEIKLSNFELKGETKFYNSK